MPKIGFNKNILSEFGHKFWNDSSFCLKTMASFAAFVIGVLIYSDLPSKEEVASEEITTEISTTNRNFVEYELTGPDSVRAAGPLLTHEFHFSSGQIYTMKGDLERPSIEFKDVNRQEWITETRQAGCTIAQETLVFDKNEDGFAPENIDYLKGVAERYMELNCD